MHELGVVSGSTVNFQPLFDVVPQWAPLEKQISERLSASSHGDFPTWQAALARLPEVNVDAVDFKDTITVSGRVSVEQESQLRTALMALHPWRKGPFDLFGIKIDSEWRSDWKWQRAAPHLENLQDARVLDVGCANGYFGWRLLAAGARLIAGVDPTLVYFMQHQAINHYVGSARNWVVPLTFEALPQAEFDVVLSMGVIYHRRQPIQHVQQLYTFTRPGGEVLLESLVVSDPSGLEPNGRYARMRNISLIPSTQLLSDWLHDAGFVDVKIVDISATTPHEQRRTSWMQFESLAAALQKSDDTRTVEGHPAPVRAMVLARRPHARW